MDPSIPGPQVPPWLRLCWDGAEAWAEAVRRTGPPDMRPTCRGAGCCACCRGEVAVSPAEVQVVLAAMGPMATLRVLAGSGYPDGVCPLLNPWDGSCTVYAVRPQTCRLYHVATPPDWCDPVKHPGQQVGLLVDPAWAALAGAVCNDDPDTLVPLWPSLRAALNAR